MRHLPLVSAPALDALSIVQILSICAGRNRFQAPQPPQFQSGVQVANVHPVGCPQAGEADLNTNPFRGVLGTGSGISKRGGPKRQSNSEIEDCLFLKSVK